MWTTNAILLLAVAAACCSAAPSMPLNLTTPNVDVGTEFFTFYNATLGRNITAFEVYRINNVLAWGLEGDNAASPGGEIGFITLQYGQTTGYILRYCVEVMLPVGATHHDLEHGSTGAFGPYQCCNGGQCQNCNYQGSGTNQNPAMVGRSFNLDVPQWSNGMSSDYGWWYSFNSQGYCEPTQDLGTNGCTYRANPYVDTVKLQDINSQPGWFPVPANPQQYQQVNNMLVNAFNSTLMSAFTYNPTANSYSPVNGRVRADPSMQCAVRCAFGTYSTNGLVDVFSSNGQCVACPTGYYSDVLGATSCKKCPNNSTTNGAGAPSVQACFSPSTPICQPGSYNQYTGHSPCTLCPAGSYQPQIGATTCVACPKFTLSNAVGNASVSTCVLQPPQAVMAYTYSTTATAAADIGGVISPANVAGVISYLQSNNYGQTLSANGSLSYRCVEAVNETFYLNPYSCWGTYCTFPTNVDNLPINGTSGQWASPTYNNGQWYEFPSVSECNSMQLPGQGGCTWKASTISLSAPISVLEQAGFYSCQISNPNSYCYSLLTTQQWANSTSVITNLAKYGRWNSSVAPAGSPIGPVRMQNGKCVVDCPAGFVFRSAFTAPHCVPANSSNTNQPASSLISYNYGPSFNFSYGNNSYYYSFIANDDVEAMDVSSGSNNKEAASSSSSATTFVSLAVGFVAVVCAVVAVVMYRMRRNRRQFIEFL